MSGAITVLVLTRGGGSNPPAPQPLHRPRLLTSLLAALPKVMPVPAAPPATGRYLDVYA